MLLTHHLELLAGYDRVLVFDEGRVVADATPETAVEHYRATDAGGPVSLLGLYVPGRSILHRTPAGAKLLGLIGLAVLSQLLGQWWQRCLLLTVVLLLYPLARIGLGFALRQLRSLWWVLAAIAVAQIVFAGWRLAVSVVATIAVLVLAAGLVTLTTTTTALSDVVVRVLGPFRRFGRRARAGGSADGAVHPSRARRARAGRADP